MVEGFQDRSQFLLDLFKGLDCDGDFRFAGVGIDSSDLAQQLQGGELVFLAIGMLNSMD